MFQGIVRDSRGQCAAEEDTLKHFQQIIIIVQKYGAQKTPVKTLIIALEYVAVNVA